MLGSRPRSSQGRVEEDYLSRLNAAITTIRGVNRTNVLTLGRTFKSVAGMMQVHTPDTSTLHAAVRIASNDAIMRVSLLACFSAHLAKSPRPLSINAQASMEELLACPGIGPTKVRRLYDTFHEPFRRTLQQPETGSQPAAVSQPGSSGQQQQQQQSADTAAAAAAVVDDGIAEIGGDEDEIEAGDPHAGAFAFM